jgi:hypothetical protein
MSEREARKQIIERAAIEFDPAVVSVLLSLQDLEELKSFAKTSDPLATPTSRADDDWTIFSSFMR